MSGNGRADERKLIDISVYVTQDHAVSHWFLSHHSCLAFLVPPPSPKETFSLAFSTTSMPEPGSFSNHADPALCLHIACYGLQNATIALPIDDGVFNWH